MANPNYSTRTPWGNLQPLVWKKKRKKPTARERMRERESAKIPRASTRLLLANITPGIIWGNGSGSGIILAGTGNQAWAMSHEPRANSISNALSAYMRPMQEQVQVYCCWNVYNRQRQWQRLCACVCVSCFLFRFVFALAAHVDHVHRIRLRRATIPLKSASTHIHTRTHLPPTITTHIHIHMYGLVVSMPVPL